MTAEILTTLTIDGDHLIYRGQIITGTKKIPITGRVSWRPTTGAIKRAIGDDIKRQIAEYQASQEPVITTIVLPEGGKFVGELS